MYNKIIYYGTGSQQAEPKSGQGEHGQLKMVSFTLKKTRIVSNLPIWIRLQETSTKQLHPGQGNATIVNISKDGACLHIPQPLINGKHLFYATLNSTHTLLLQSQDTTNKIDDFSISAQSVWMDSFKHVNKLWFKVGVCFTTPQIQLFKTLKDAPVSFCKNT